MTFFGGAMDEDGLDSDGTNPAGNVGDAVDELGDPCESLFLSPRERRRDFMT
jgi:hypothetical protein